MGRPIRLKMDRRNFEHIEVMKFKRFFICIYCKKKKRLKKAQSLRKTICDKCLHPKKKRRKNDKKD